MDYTQFTILVVDDEAPFRKYLKKIIETEFHLTVLESKNPNDAFELLKTTIPSLVLLDMEMPYMDGFTFLKELREQEQFVSLPVIACTALGSKELFLGLHKLKIIDYILKPANTRIIIEKVRNALNTLEPVQGE
jgi:CheY-like chemotaxis protein